MLKQGSCLFFLLLGLVHGLAATPTGNSLVSNKKVVIVGGGPVGLYFATLMSQKDPTVQIEILEKRTGKPTVNAFGMGLGSRTQNRLKDVPGLLENVMEIGPIVNGVNLPMVDRGEMTRQMGSFMLDMFGANCKLTYGEECSSVDFEEKVITTSSGRTLQYDLLLAADGVNSKIRQKLVEKEPETFQEQHFLENAHWKALSLPKQPDIQGGSFKPLRHPSIAGGRVLPRAPEGHIALLVWRDEHGIDNPAGVETTEDLKQMLTEAMQDKESRNPLGKLLGLEQGKKLKRDLKVAFDEAALEAFISKRAGRSHHMKINQYHYQDSVALIGDSAHAMNSLLGQGCATGLESARTLVECLVGEHHEKSLSCTMEEALSKYTELATKEAHAMTELSLIHFATKGRLTMVKALPLILFNKLRGREFMKRLVDISVPYSQIANENKWLLKMCRRKFEKVRRPLDGNIKDGN